MQILKTKNFLKDCNDYLNSAGIISIAGGSGSGKSYFSKKLAKKIDARILSLDDYIIPEMITPDSNWDLPECWNLNLVRSNLNSFIQDKKFIKPIYNFKTGNNNHYEIIPSDKPIILEGLYSLFLF